MNYEIALYLVGTPIGNLSDLSPRAIETLQTVDFIAAEDTRVTAKLLNHFDIHKPLISLFRHNEKQRAEEIIQRIEGGESCALVTDAGMPAISDPGEETVRLCAERGVPVYAVPGPSAAICALALSGLPTGRFTFEGFLSTNRVSRMEHLASLVNEPRTMIFYEAPHKLIRTLTDFLEVFGPDRRISLCRELTKLHEETLRLTLAQAVSHFNETAPRGEFVLILEPSPKAPPEEATPETIMREVQSLLEHGLSKNAAIKQVSQKLGVPRNQVYSLVLSQFTKM